MAGLNPFPDSGVKIRQLEIEVKRLENKLRRNEELFEELFELQEEEIGDLKRKSFLLEVEFSKKIQEFNEISKLLERYKAEKENTEK